MVKRFYPIIIVTFLLFNISTFFISQTATASEYQGVGDWVIEDNTTITGETIVVYGNVIVKDGGSLTLDHCTLKIESIVPGNNGIEVEAGGGLYVYDTTITSNGELQYYYFTVYGKLMIDGGDISKMFRNGLEISDTKDIMIKNSKVHDNGPYAPGIRFSNSTGEIIRNNIYKNFRGVETAKDSVVTITNNIITSNREVGIICGHNSKVNINNNTISDTYSELGRGIEIQDNSVGSIANNVITSNKQYGIFCSDDSKVNITNNIITSNEQVGIICFDNSKVSMISNTISDTYGEKGRGIEIQDNSTVTIANNIITSNRKDGILCGENSNVNINNNTISDAYNPDGRGISIQGNTIAGIANNIITSNNDVGIFCSDDAEVNINNNTISDTYSPDGRGINIRGNSVVTIADNIITSNKGNGINCFENSKVNINNNTISRNKGGFIGGRGIEAHDSSTVNVNDNDIILNELGMVVWDLADVKIHNSRIIESTEYDIWVDNSSNPTLINTQFDLNKLFFNDTESIISIGHWLDVNVQNKNNVPVQNARVAVMNNNGTEVFNGTSDYDGHVSSIPIVEYDLDYTFTKKFHTPHTVYASKLGQSASEEITVDRNRVVNFTLDVSDKLARGNLITQIVEGHEVFVEYSGNGTVTIDSATKPAEIPNATEDIGIFVNINAVGDVEDLYITIRYSDNELGKVNEANLRMYCYFDPDDFHPGDFHPGDFELLNPGNFTGGWVRVKESGVDIYGNVVWAKVSHLTIFAPMAEEIAKPKGGSSPWLLYGGVGATSLAILWIVFLTIFRKRIFHKSKAGK